MAKTKRNVGREILDGLREIKRGEYGRVINVPDVAMIREKTGLSQSRFASLLGVSVRTLQDWEQGRRAPSGGRQETAGAPSRRLRRKPPRGRAVTTLPGFFPE
jgi:putative transcriptional regulator